jgi:hypothetical protein
MTTKSILPCPDGTIWDGCGEEACIEEIANSAEEEEREVI